MKHLLFILIAYFLSIDYALGQSAFYYFKGQKVHLNALSDINTLNINDYRTFLDENNVKVSTTDFLYVKLKNESDINLLKEDANNFGAEIVSQNQYMPLWYTLKVSDNSKNTALNIANTLFETGKFAAAEPDLMYDGIELSHDSLITRQWGLYNKQYEDIDISISEAWNYATGRGVNIAIIDEGVDHNHKDLAPNIYKTYNAETNASPNTSYSNHGTHCAGIAAAVRNNWTGISGVAPDANLMSVRICFESYHINEVISRGINWAWRNGADILSCSWFAKESQLISDAIDNALKYGRNGKGCLIVKSAGNTSKAISWPGGYSEEIIAVANIKREGVRAENSSHGQNMLISAPGTDILSTVQSNRYEYMDGTSMAAPHVTGVIALLLEINPELTSRQIREFMGRSAKKIGDVEYVKDIKPYGSWNEYYGYGLINAIGCVRLALPYLAPEGKPEF